MVRPGSVARVMNQLTALHFIKIISVCGDIFSLQRTVRTDEIVA